MLINIDKYSDLPVFRLKITLSNYNVTL